MKSLNQAKGILLGAFVGMVFLAQVISWAVINHLGAFGLSVWGVAGTALLMTASTCSLYLILRKLLQKFKGQEETTIAEDMYEIFRADR